MTKNLRHVAEIMIAFKINFHLPEPRSVIQVFEFERLEFNTIRRFTSEKELHAAIQQKLVFLAPLIAAQILIYIYIYTYCTFVLHILSKILKQYSCFQIAQTNTTHYNFESFRISNYQKKKVCIVLVNFMWNKTKTKIVCLQHLNTRGNPFITAQHYNCAYVIKYCNFL